MNRNNMNTIDRWYDPTALGDKMKEADVVKCNCGCPYLEQVEVQRFPKMHNVILGQKVQPQGDMSFFVFRCIKCNEVYEPSVQLAARDQSRKAYEDFLDEMEKPLRDVKAEPEVLQT